jgi:hypothetical protein
VQNGLLGVLQRELENRRILIVASTENDASAALDAVQALEGKMRVAIIGVWPLVDGAKQATMNTPSDFLGLVGADVNCYGPKVMELASELFIGNHVSPYNFIPHKFFHCDDCAFFDQEKVRSHGEDPETTKGVVSESYATTLSERRL